MFLRAFVAVLGLTAVVTLAGCGGKDASNADVCSSVEGQYSGKYSVASQGDCGPDDTYETNDVTVDVFVTNGSVYLSAAGESCQGALSPTCAGTTLAGVCSGIVGIGDRQYPNLSRVAFGAGGSLLVANINKMPSNSQTQCMLQVQFIGEKTR
jgi:hypothetical protein